jgi:hypothetical protein
MFKKIMLWFLCKIDQPIYSPSRPDKACLHCGKYHGANANIFKRHTSPMHLMGENTIGGEPLQIDKSPTKRAPDAGDSAE